MIDIRTSPAADGRCCPLCGGQQFEELHHWPIEHRRNPTRLALSYWQCRCGLALLHPLPTVADWRAAASESDRGGDGTADQVSRTTGFARLRDTLHRWMFGSPEARLLQHTSRLISHGRLLDVGCGAGELLREASRRFVCVGVEPHVRTAERARQAGFRVVSGTINTADLPAATFDVVTMSATLQQAADPIRALQDANHVLRAGGVVAVRVPKLFGPGHRWFGRDWSGFDLGRSFSMFTAETLRLSLAATGFAPVSRPLRDRAWDDVLIVWARKVRESELEDSVLAPTQRNLRSAA